MQIEPLENILLDLEGTAAHLAALSKVLEGHAVYLRHMPGPDNGADIDSIERQLNGLASSISDLRGVAQKISKVA
ncbi:hypothetical protein [Pseudomonas sp. NPDC007930]|uniref:hypothetical protein n=1 Tax=Pseudomonas sp. NPDC007930 TaxID=3364417 RepID=UPI0036EEF77E